MPKGIWTSVTDGGSPESRDWRYGDGTRFDSDWWWCGGQPDNQNIWESAAFGAAEVEENCVVMLDAAVGLCYHDRKFVLVWGLLEDIFIYYL